ncbi:hypothetical protein AB0K60_08770 [Thermopolyspora sp. NPDC052614]|uniref:hypothetical protein n=1 Tax=Thermopolyspora sp. NPDC052614 TaxID=3155682 RepID=UPI00341FFC1E
MLVDWMVVATLPAHFTLVMATGGVLPRVARLVGAESAATGLSYGFLWWILGALTLFPLLLGGAPRWDAATLAALFPSLIGHLSYGAALGLVYYALESRVSPWWLTRGQVEAERVAARRAQVLGSAPALWTLITLTALTVPLLIE